MLYFSPYIMKDVRGGKDIESNDLFGKAVNR